MSDAGESLRPVQSVVQDAPTPPAADNDQSSREQAAISTSANSPLPSHDFDRDLPASVATHQAGTDGDSEAETLIESPEKRKNVVDNAPRLEPINPGDVEGNHEVAIATRENGLSRKRKRIEGAHHDETISIYRPPSRRSSPLSSPIPDAHLSKSSDSEVSSQRSWNERGSSGDPEEKAARGLTIEHYEPRKRRSSDNPEEHPTHRTTRKRQKLESNSGRRETRSATYPQRSSGERSLSSGPAEPRRVASAASCHISSLALNREKRLPPPFVHSRRDSISSEASSSPVTNLPTLHKFTSTDNDGLSPAKTMGHRKFRDKNGRTFLARACAVNDLEAAKARLEERPSDLNVSDNAGNTPLQIASLEGFVQIVEFLLKKGCEVDTKNIDQETSLIDAVENGHVEVVSLLLDHGANPRLGNKEGDEPYELAVGVDNEHEIRKLIAQAKDQDTMRRKSEDHTNSGLPREGSSRAASAASARDSPSVLGPRSPPAPSLSRRRTGRSEFTRNDLLWQANTQENLTKLAGQGDVQGVASILNILQKAEPEALIAAAKGKHDEVLQYLLGMGDPDPDPDPIRTAKPGFNTPMLAAIGRGNTVVIQLLVDQAGFNPTREFKGRTYPDISRERKGENWEKEVEILQSAYDKFEGSKSRKHSSPRKIRDRDKDKRRDQKLPSPQLSQKEAKTSNTGMAVSSDHDDHQPQVKTHESRRSHSDLPVRDMQKRRKLVPGKEHRQRSSITSSSLSDADDSSTARIKHERAPVLKRQRRSPTPERALERPKSQDSDLARTIAKRRRMISDSSPENAKSTPGLTKLASEEDSKVLSDVDDIFRRSQNSRRKQEGPTADLPTPYSPEDFMFPPEHSAGGPRKLTLSLTDAEREKKLAEEKKKEATEQAMQVARREENARIQAIKDAADALARQQEIEVAAAQQRKLDEEIAAKKKAEENAIARQKEEEHRQECLKKEAEEKQRRQEERKQREFQEAEKRKREALPGLLCKTALMHDRGDPTVRSTLWLKRFLPLYMVWTKQMEPDCGADIAEEEWVLNFQVAGLLGTKDLHLLQYTQLEKRDFKEEWKEPVWRWANVMLSYDYVPKAWTQTYTQAFALEEHSRPRFMAMEDLFWVKLPGFMDQVPRHPHLQGLSLRPTRCNLRPRSEKVLSGAVGSAPQNPPTPQTNGVSPSMSAFTDDIPDDHPLRQSG